MSTRIICTTPTITVAQHVLLTINVWTQATCQAEQKDKAVFCQEFSSCCFVRISQHSSLPTLSLNTTVWGKGLIQSRSKLTWRLEIGDKKTLVTTYQLLQQQWELMIRFWTICSIPAGTASHGRCFLLLGRPQRSDTSCEGEK